jgi:hypothetical protein
MSMGPVEDATEKQAWENVEVFIKDTRLNGVEFGRHPEAKDGDGGRFSYVLRLGDRSCEVAMPGIPTEKVRWLDRDGQNIWHFPRLYVNGSSWAWKFAVSQVREALTGEDDDE